MKFNLTTCSDCGCIVTFEEETATYTGEINNKKNLELHAKWHLKIHKALGTLYLTKEEPTK